MIDDDLKWIFKWYYDQCNGNWKHGKEFKIQTFDNPGWDLTINLEQTQLLDKQFKEVNIDRSEHDWIQCYIRDKAFNGLGGPFNFPEILALFRNWVENSQKSDKIVNSRDFEPAELKKIVQTFLEDKSSNNNLMWLIRWFYSLCNGDWEHLNLVYICAIDPGWYVKIGIYGIELEDIHFEKVFFDRSENNWIQCFKQNSKFIGLGGPFNLFEIIEIFRKWVEKYQVEKLA